MESNMLSLVHAHSDVSVMITRIMEKTFFIINTSFYISMVSSCCLPANYRGSEFFPCAPVE